MVQIGQHYVPQPRGLPSSRRDFFRVGVGLTPSSRVG
jgi:hypothetical protein